MRKWFKVLGIGAAVVIGGDLIALATVAVPKAKPHAADTPVVGTAKKNDPALEMATLAVASIREAARDPESLVVERVSATPDGRWACVAYRARNGFGGMNREHAAFSKAGGSTSARAWNKHCLDPALVDETRNAKMLSGFVSRS